MGKIIGFGNGLGIRKGSNVNFSREVDIYKQGLTTPLSSDQDLKLRSFVVDLKKGLGIKNLSDAFDVMYILAGETAESSLKNLVKDAYHCTAVNAPAFTKFEGFTGDGASNYLDTNYNANEHGDKYTVNNASFGIYRRSGSSSVALIGARSTYSSAISIVPGGVSYLVINMNETDAAFDIPYTQHGIYILTRPNSSQIIAHANGNKYNATKSSAGMPNLNNWILGRNYQSGQFSSVQISFAFFGRNLTDSDVNVLKDLIESYMDSNGKGVIA